MVLDMDMDTTESVMLSQRPMLTPTFCMVDTTDMVLDTMDMVLDMDMDTTESVMLSQRLMLTPTFCMVDTTDMVLDMDMDTMESVRLNQRLMLMLTCTVDIMVLEDMVDIMDIDIMESALLMLSPRLTPTFCMEDMDTLDTPMLLTVITDKLFPLVLWTANHPCFLYQ